MLDYSLKLTGNTVLSKYIAAVVTCSSQELSIEHHRYDMQQCKSMGNFLFNIELNLPFYSRHTMETAGASSAWMAHCVI